MNAPEHLSATAAGTYQRLFEARGELVALRRELHTMPELGFEEHRTAARIVQALKACGVDEIHQGLGRTGIVATIHGQPVPGAAPDAKPRLFGLRADMDALPLREQNDFAWRSSTPGLMHACGHDGHCAMLVGTARYLAQTRRFAGTAVLVRSETVATMRAESGGCGCTDAKGASATPALRGAPGGTGGGKGPIIIKCPLVCRYEMDCEWHLGKDGRVIPVCVPILFCRRECPSEPA